LPSKVGREGNLGNNRDHLSLLAALIHAASEGSNKTRIMYAANLSYKLLEKYLEEALGFGLLQTVGSVYLVTEKGHEFLKKYVAFSDNHSHVKNHVRALALEREKLEQYCRKDCANKLPIEQTPDNRGSS
jgi:predicted transcriptional regulator